MNANKYLIYDAHCPLCQWYSKKFVSLGFLNPGERLSFEEAQNQGLMTDVDMSKAKNEIPLYVPSANMILYGTDSIVFLLNLKIPGIKSLYVIPPIKWFFKFAYNLISYNRRIVPAQKCKDPACPSEPGFNRFYRLLFMVIAITTATIITLKYGDFFVAMNLIDSPVQMLFMCGGGWVLTGFIAALKLRGRLLWDYLGNLSTIMLIGVLLLVPALISTQWGSYPEIFIISTGLSFYIMLKSHLTRLRNLGLQIYWVWLWVGSLLLFFGPKLILNFL